MGGATHDLLCPYPYLPLPTCGLGITRQLRPVRGRSASGWCAAQHWHPSRQCWRSSLCLGWWVGPLPLWVRLPRVVLGYVLLLGRRKFPPPCLVPRAVVPPHATPCPLTEASEHLHPSLNLGKPVVGQACRGLQGHPLLLSRRVKALWDTCTSWKKLFKACAGTSSMMWLPPLARPHSSGLCAWTVRCPVSATPACSISNAMRAHGPTAGVGGPPTCNTAFLTLARRGFPPLAIRFCVRFGYDRPQTPRTIPCLFIHVAGLGLWCDSSALG